MNNITVLMPENGEQSFTKNKIAKFQITDLAIAEMKERYMSLTVAGIEDTKGLKIVHDARMIVKSKRLLVDKTADELNTEAKQYIQIVNEEKKRIKELLEPIENYLEGVEDDIKNKREVLKREAVERENKRIQDRINQISAYGYAVDYSEIRSMTDIAFNDLLEQARIEHKKDIAAKLEAERLRIEETERLKQERDELDALRKQQQYEANILKAEQVRVQKEQEARERAIKAEQGKIDAEKKEAELHKEKIEQARLKVIEDEKRKAAQKLENERLAKESEERELALRPDKEKLQAFAKQLSELKLPDVINEESQFIVDTVETQLYNIQQYILFKINGASVIMAEFDPESTATIIDGAKLYEENDLLTTTK